MNPKNVSQLTKNILNKIITLRQQIGISQEQMATRLRIHYPVYVSIEKGERKLELDLIERIAEIFAKSFKDLAD